MSSVDLARQALLSAREAAKKNDATQAKKPKRRTGTQYAEQPCLRRIVFPRGQWGHPRGRTEQGFRGTRGSPLEGTVPAGAAKQPCAR
ncbi:hypothetical protein OHB13_38220 (plasmid) [Streptomyces sp. NBC_00440]|uniref:hypothetical protein n=1 Tax=Streptomyces sp. NBC_00440 TaxID=2975741 RepID=UPI002E1EB2F1